MMVQSAYFIIWNSSKRNFDSICSEIEKNTIVKSKKNIEIKKYYNLICDLYEFNNQRELGVYKATKMCNNSKYEIVILDIEFYSKESSDFSFVKCNGKRACLCVTMRSFLYSDLGHVIIVYQAIELCTYMWDLDNDRYLYLSI